MKKLPTITPIYPISAYFFPAFSFAIICDILSNTTTIYRRRLRVLGCVFFVAASLVSLAPLKPIFVDLAKIFNAYKMQDNSVLFAAWESLQALSQYPSEHQRAAITSISLALLGGVIGIGTLLSNKRTRINRVSSSGPWSSGWMNENDIRYLSSNKSGIPLALVDGKILRYAKNDKKGWRGGHHLVVSGTRGGKGVSAVIPAVLEHCGPVVAIDIKGENFAITKRYREKLGRKVVVLNPFELVTKSPDQYNPLDYIRPNDLVRDIAVITDGLVKPEKGESSHFSDMARQLISAAIEVVVLCAEPKDRNLKYVSELLLSDNLDQTLNAWIENVDLIGHRPAQTASTILRAGDRERGSIQTTVSKAFEWMKADNVRNTILSSNFNMDDLVQDKLDIFIVIPLDQIDHQSVFMRLIINVVLGTVIRLDGKSKVRSNILLALDEFVRMGRMEQILNIANVAAGVGIDALFVTQDIGQVVSAYVKHDARSIFGSCITKRIFNINDIETAEWVSRHFGDQTLYSKQIRKSSQLDESYSETKDKIMSAEQVLELNSDEVLLLIGNRRPLKARQNKYYENRMYSGKWDQNPLI